MRTLNLLHASLLLCCTASLSNAADLSADFNRLFLKGSPELPNEAGTTRVETLATGDFNCDGIHDLAVGDEFGEVTGVAGNSHGSVSVGFGDRFSGLRVGGQLINQNTSGVIGAAETDDFFGAALAADDFDADGCDDLAIGVPGEDDASAGTTNSGGVNVLFGSTSGLSGSNDIFVPGTEAAPHGTTNAHMKGEALASLNNWTATGSQPFLAISAIGHASGISQLVGGVAVRRGGTTPLATPVDFVERADFPGDSNRSGGCFGAPLAAGDFNNDGFDDLVTRTTSEGFIFPDPGLCIQGDSAIWVVYGASATAGFVYEKITQNSPGVPGSINEFDGFGEALAVGDFNNDGEDDLVVGAPNEDVGATGEAGTVTVLYGATSRLLANAVTSIAFDQSSIAGAAPEANDNFGAALATGDFNRDGFDDLAIGAPGEGFGSIVAGGSIVVVYGSASGINTATSKVFDMGTAGIVGNIEANDAFGDSLSAGDFNNDQVDDLAVGLRGRRNGGNLRGAVSLIFSSGDTATSIQSISPSPVLAGRPYTVTVRSRRLNTGGTQLGRGTVNVDVSGGGACTATLNSQGDGSCQIAVANFGFHTVNASFPGVIGYRASVAPSINLNVIAPPQNIFANSFE